MKILAVDTAEDACSAALWVDGEVRSRYAIAPREHNQLILRMMDDLLTEALLVLRQLDGLAVCRGPGSFTGIRIATAVVQGAAFAADLPVASVSSLLALAARAQREQGARRIAVALDARMDEVYWAAVEIDKQGVPLLRGSERVVAPERVPLPDGAGWLGVGSGWASYAARLRQRLGKRLGGVLPEMRVHAHDVALLGARAFAAGEQRAPEQAQPLYLRDQVAWKKG